jgi:hypothetical protein
MSKSIPDSDSSFDTFQSIVYTAVDANKETWGIDLFWLANYYTPAYETWNDKWYNYQDPNTRTSVITFEKNEARKALEKELRIMVKNLESNTLVTDDQRIAMGIPLPSGYHPPLPPPSTRPELDIKTPLPRRLEVYFSDEGSAGRARPHGVAGAVIHWAILSAPPAEVEELFNSALDTRSPFTLDFRESERGQTVFFCAAWQNPTGEKGPWSNIEHAIIP